jgi:uncharacterized protein YndB with AHSA1/START domain
MTPTVHGKVTREREHATLEFEVLLDHEPAEVWEAITDPVQLSEWYMMQATVEPRLGGTIEFSGGPVGYHVKGRILAWEPPRIFSYEWKIGPSPRSPRGEDSIVTWELAGDGAGTFLRVTHKRLTTEIASGVAPATHVLVERLAALLDGRPLPEMRPRSKAVRSLYEANDRA